MKTLDEVITVMDHVEFCCTNCKLQFDCDEVECFLEDALHYLKEFKRVQNKIEKIALGNIEDTLDQLDNKPLTWDELKTMIGKPIWVKYEGYTPNWEIIEYIGDTKWKWGEVVETNLSILHKENQGKEWQAYRKETI